MPGTGPLGTACGTCATTNSSAVLFEIAPSDVRPGTRYAAKSSSGTEASVGLILPSYRENGALPTSAANVAWTGAYWRLIAPNKPASLKSSSPFLPLDPAGG